MHHTIDFPSIKSNFVRKPFLTAYKRHNPPPPPGFKILNFSFFLFTLIISTQTTYFNKKLRTLLRFTTPESDFRFVQFFLYTLYIKCSSSSKNADTNSIILWDISNKETDLPVGIQHCHEAKLHMSQTLIKANIPYHRFWCICLAKFTRNILKMQII